MRSRVSGRPLLPVGPSGGGGGPRSGPQSEARIGPSSSSTLGRLVGGRFEACEEFTALQGAYRFRAHHCTPGQGHEKGLVENLVGYIRRAYLVPLPEVGSLEELNRLLAVSSHRRRPGAVGRARRRELAKARTFTRTRGGPSAMAWRVKGSGAAGGRPRRTTGSAPRPSRLCESPGGPEAYSVFFGSC